MRSCYTIRLNFEIDGGAQLAHNSQEEALIERMDSK